MPCSAQKSSISWVSAMPPISEPAMLRRLKIRAEHVGRRMRLGRRADQDIVPSRLSSAGEGVEVVRGGDGVEDEVEAVGLRGHLRPRRCDTTTSSAPRRSASSRLARRGGEQHDLRAHRAGELDAHVAQPAEADDRRPSCPGRRLPVAQRRIGGDAGAQQRRRRGRLEPVGDAQHEALVDHDGCRSSRRRCWRRRLVGPL